MVGNVVPIRARPVPQPDLPKIVNLVSTVTLLPQFKDKRYKLPLEAISMKLGCSQYAPYLFAANIIKLTDSITDVTALLFESGKMVVVRGLTKNHTRYNSQLIRVMVENVECMLYSEADETVVEKGSLLGRTIFEQCHVHNIVGHGFLGCRINLQAMCNAAPACCKWFPDLFPGLKCKIWLTKNHRCTCKKKKAAAAAESEEEEDAALAKIIGKPGKCMCALKVLIFDSGCVVITGGRHVKHVNSVFFRIKELAPGFESNASAATQNGAIPGEDVFYQRLGTMMVPSGTTAKQVKHIKRTEMKPSDAIAIVLAGADVAASVTTAAAAAADKKARVNATANGDDVTPLMRMATAARFENVKFLVAMDPAVIAARDAQGRTALERVRAIPGHSRSVEHKLIIDFLVEEEKKLNL